MLGRSRMQKKGGGKKLIDNAKKREKRIQKKKKKKSKEQGKGINTISAIGLRLITITDIYNIQSLYTNIQPVCP